MPPSVIARFVDAFIGGFLKTMKDKLIDGGLLIAALLYWLLSGKLFAHLWESITPWIWVICLIVAWHAAKAAVQLWQEIAVGRERKTSILLTQYGEPAELPREGVGKYRTQIVGVGLLVIMICVACSYLSWMAGGLGRADDDFTHGGDIAGEVTYIDIEPVYRFYQRPPVGYDRLDAMVLLSILNRVAHPIYLRRYEVRALVDSKWVTFRSSFGLAVNQYSFGTVVDGNPPQIHHFDLSTQGFDYVL